jgi:hypothetical protein
MWEIFTLGNTPYPGMSNGDVASKVMNGYKMDITSLTCDQKWKSMMNRCWLLKPENRPSFAALLAIVEDPTVSQQGGLSEPTSNSSQDSYVPVRSQSEPKQEGESSSLSSLPPYPQQSMEPKNEKQVSETSMRFPPPQSLSFKPLPHAKPPPPSRPLPQDLKEIKLSPHIPLAETSSQYNTP